LFYEKGVGVRASAVARDIHDVELADISIINRLGLYGFRTKISLLSIERFALPVELRPLVAELDFIRNKSITGWGTGLRKSPRHISLRDYNIIIDSQQRPSALTLEDEAGAAMP
jgi:hypothetical protein